MDNDYSVMSLLSLCLSSDVCSLFSNRLKGKKFTSADVHALSAILKFTTAVEYVLLYLYNEIATPAVNTMSILNPVIHKNITDT